MASPICSLCRASFSISWREVARIARLCWVVRW